jgi:hypothetical protein
VGSAGDSTRQGAGQQDEEQSGDAQFELNRWLIWFSGPSLLGLVFGIV